MAGCAACGAENPPAFRFCGSCGSELPSGACPNCGFASPPGFRFCGQCGTALGAPEVAPVVSLPRTVAADERKLATVLFADVVGFTTLSESTDPETVARAVDAAFRRLASVVESHGGTVDKYL